MRQYDDRSNLKRNLLRERRLMRLHKSCTRHGFTLIELLIVISVIALLLSILLPSLNRAKQSARRVVCGNNLRQISTVWYTYAHDNKSKFPEAYSVDSNGRVIMPLLGNWTLLMENEWHLFNASGGVGGKVFYCPNHKKVWDRDPDVIWNSLVTNSNDANIRYVVTTYVLYGYHHYSRKYGLIPAVTKTTDRNISVTPIILDETHFYQVDHGFRYSNHFEGGRGSYKFRNTDYSAPLGGNCVMGDGSVHWRSFDKMKPLWQSTSGGGAYIRFY